VGHLQQFIALWTKVQEVHLQQGAQDRLTWKLTSSGVYGSISAYHAQFFRSVKFDLLAYLEAMGSDKMQILRLVHYQEQSVD